MNRSALFFLLSIFLVALIACTKSRPNVEVKPITLAQLDSLIQNRNGKLLLLNVWATWCVPCREEFPDLVTLANKYRSKNLDVVGLSVDYPDEIAEKIQPFVQENDVSFPIFVQNVPDQEQLINRLNAEWNGAIPATFVFDQNGRQQLFLQGKQTLTELEQAIQSVLSFR